MLINRFRADWLSTDRAVPGEPVRVLGRNLVGLDLYPERDQSGRPSSAGGYVEGRTQVVLSQGGSVVPATVEKMSAYDVHFRLPPGLELGDYTVHVHNGYGGAAGWSGGLRLTVAAEDPWPGEVFNAREYGAVGDGLADDAPAIQGALDAAGTNGGGLVYLSPGSYLINRTLTVHPRTVIRGESRERTWIWLPNGVHYGDRAIGEKMPVGLQGDRDFVVEDLTMHGVYARYLILAPIAFSDHSAPAAENVTVRRCRLMMEPTLRHPYRRGEPFLENERLDRDSSWSNRFCVAVRGDYVTVNTARVVAWAVRQAEGGDSAGFPPFLDEAAGGFRPDALKGYDCLVVDGRGLGQLRTITANTVDAATVDPAWKVAPGPESLVAICQNPQFQGHIVVDNSLTHTGSGINPWGNAYDMVIDGSRLALSGGIDIGDVGAEWTYREWAGGYHSQILNNTVAEGRYHGNWPVGQALHIFQGLIGLQGGGSVGVGGLDWVLRNNRTETDALIAIVPPATARYRGIILENNRSVESRTGIRVGSGVSGALRGNTSERVDQPLWDEGSSLWVHPAEALRLQLEGFRTLLEEEGISAALDWERMLEDLSDQAALPPGEEKLPALRSALLRDVAQAVGHGAPEGTSLRVLESLTGLELAAASDYSLQEVLAAGQGGRGAITLTARLPESWGEMELELAPSWPAGWQAEAPAIRRQLAGGQEARLELPVSVPGSAWGGYALPLRVRASCDDVDLAARATFSIGRGDVGEWHLIGPFRNTEGADLDHKGHPPENRLDLASRYECLEGETAWKPHSGPARLELSPMLGSSGPRTAYAIAVLRAAARLSAVLELEAADGARAWLNQAEVATVRGEPALVSRPVQLSEGENILVVKVSTRRHEWSVRASITEQGAGGRLSVLPATEASALPLLNPPRLPDAVELVHGGGGHRVSRFGSDLITAEVPAAKPNQWFHVIAQLFASGRVEVIVDGQVCMTVRGQPPADAPRYAGIWTWQAAEFDDIRIYTGG